MAQGEFTKEEAARMREAVDDLFNGLPKSRRFGYIGHLNDILLFIGAAEKTMQDKAPVAKRR